MPLEEILLSSKNPLTCHASSGHKVRYLVNKEEWFSLRKDLLYILFG